MVSGSSAFRRGSDFTHELVLPTQRQACRRLRGDTPHQFARRRYVADKSDAFADRHVCRVVVSGLIGGFDLGQFGFLTSSAGATGRKVIPDGS
jgi:hypothetical protein